ncbi:winged helix-turn-helix domain-containing protein [Halosimplex salinum]|uniref:winged helix-turn-helix domain-containing protein n=1 Tax=Halosimplex salinum TaxID=1710538 RepID=UPI000F4AC92C|nr:winged helix-turn-helix domain-containing protein [Halosimplex salinum]
MEGTLWHVLTGTRGGRNRIRVLQAIDDRPRNAHQLADDLDYKTVRHHFDVLLDNDIVDKSGDVVADYDVALRGGAVYTAFAQGYLTPDDEPADEAFDLNVVRDASY